MDPENGENITGRQCSGTCELLELLEDLLAKGSVSPRSRVLESMEDQARLEKILTDIGQIGHFSLSIANGDLGGEMTAKGYIAGSLKSLQSSLRHLTWQAQQIAAGDLTQQVDYMGDFSESFNVMVANLRKAREERARNEEALREANRKLALLSGITRHDIVNQLTALKGYIALSYEYLEDPLQLRVFLDKENMAADTIWDQILFTKYYQDMGVSDPVWQGIGNNIGKAAGSLQAGEITIVSDCQDIELFADPMLRQVFYNLIDNALNYGGETMHVIRISCRSEDPNLIVTCEDDGIGIPENEKELIFRHGYGKHTGLGLFLVREILGITGMTIRETGIYGKGARFEITVPPGIFRTAGKPGDSSGM